MRLSRLAKFPGYAQKCGAGDQPAQLFAQSQVVAYFDRLPPLTNGGIAQNIAMALDASGDKARATAKFARDAWRGGPLSDDDEARLFRIAGTPA